MPAFLGGLNSVMGLKTVSVFHGNTKIDIGEGTVANGIVYIPLFTHFFPVLFADDASAVVGDPVAPGEGRAV